MPTSTMQRLVRRGISRLPRNSTSSLYEFNQIKIRSEVRASDYSMLDVAEVIAVRNKGILEQITVTIRDFMGARFEQNRWPQCQLAKAGSAPTPGGPAM